jgi:hypothetical protein
MMVLEATATATATATVVGFVAAVAVTDDVQSSMRTTRAIIG